MLEVPAGLELVVQGLKTNLFGLGCPFYCSPPGLGTILAAFLSGLLSGIGLCLWLVFRFDLLAVPTSSPSGSGPGFPTTSPPTGRAKLALRSYLHEPRSRC